MTQRILKRISERLKAMKCMRYGSILNTLVFCSILWCMVAFLSGFDSPSTIVLPEVSFTHQLNRKRKADKYVAVWPVNLRCEYLVNPLGIDVVRPRLSWIVESPENGQSQSTYQIQIASSADALNAGAPDIWDSGVVTSDDTVNIHYAGKELVSSQRYYWQVSIWDKDGNRGR